MKIYEFFCVFLTIAMLYSSYSKGTNVPLFVKSENRWTSGVSSLSEKLSLFSRRLKGENMSIISSHRYIIPCKKTVREGGLFVSINFQVYLL